MTRYAELGSFSGSRRGGVAVSACLLFIPLLAPRAFAQPPTEDAVAVQAGGLAIPDAILHGGFPIESDRRGDSVACSADGTRAIVGSSRVGARIFVHGASGWVLEHEVRAPDLDETELEVLRARDQARGDRFGAAVAIADEGSRIVVGAPGHDAPIADAGSARERVPFEPSSPAVSRQRCPAALSRRMAVMPVTTPPCARDGARSMRPVMAASRAIGPVHRRG